MSKRNRWYVVDVRMRRGAALWSTRYEWLARMVATMVRGDYGRPGRELLKVTR